MRSPDCHHCPPRMRQRADPVERGSGGGGGEVRQRAHGPHLQRLLEPGRVQDPHLLQRQDPAGARPPQGHRPLRKCPHLTTVSVT